ncbi:MAG: SRPBCC domain-containing protein [Bacteroidota bacterium]
MKQTIYNIDPASDTTMLVEREFDATLEWVWQAWTDSELLAEWWAPLPFKAITKTMDFREGGRWHYYMLGPDGSKFWCLLNYLQIENLNGLRLKMHFAMKQVIKTLSCPICIGKIYLRLPAPVPK